MIGIEMKKPSNCGECPLLEKCNNPRHPFVICKASVQPKEISIFNVINDVQINCPLVPAIPLDRIKQAKEEMSERIRACIILGGTERAKGLEEARTVLDKLIAEVEKKES